MLEMTRSKEGTINNEDDGRIKRKSKGRNAQCDGDEVQGSSAKELQSGDRSV